MTTDIPMLRDGTVYEVYIIRKNGDCSKNEIKAIEKLCNVNYIKAEGKLVDKVFLLRKGTL